MRAEPKRDSYVVLVMSIRRKELRMAQARLASLTGISQPRLSAIERQHAEPTEEELKAIAAVLCEKDPDMLMLPYADYILQRQGVKRPGG